ncbi:BLUF domain-containing protein [Falsiroseomonas selenitidurans]|uniref:BLUF domain-containing protein n=1 Tax=Falsiroseomonas selenitidurans TaxID=2716335 RepID=A0ABX1E4L8_9PROT|nr:BLUF domain-containing protein [Falsiroseomonas selenitidurans]NKC32124.1 BLUF domain-containing protein [Falsiroseomonas selenitidurans]
MTAPAATKAAAPALAAAPLMQLIYASRPFGFSGDMLDDILMTARHNNRRDGLTGALICRADLFLQMLEGPRDKVTATFGRILRDDRHLEVSLVWSGDAPARLFGHWDMLEDPARSWMWSREEVRAGAMLRASAAEAREVFDRVAGEVA